MSLFLVLINLLRLAIGVEFLLQLLGYLLITRLAVEVVQLVGVVLKVVQLVVVHLVVLRFEVADADEFSAVPSMPWYLFSGTASSPPLP